MRRERRPRLKARHQRTALGGLVFPDPLLPDLWARLDPGQLAQREDLRRRRALPVGGGLDIPGENSQHRRAVRDRDGMDTAVGTVTHIPSGPRPGLVRDGAFDDKDQLVADVPMEGELRAGREASHLGPSLRRRVLPEELEADSGPILLPSKVTNRDDL